MVKLVKKTPQRPQKEWEVPIQLPTFSLNCPISEKTGDGVLVGRCWYYCPNGVCPRHGNVRRELIHYWETKHLTSESEKYRR